MTDGKTIVLEFNHDSMAGNAFREQIEEQSMVPMTVAIGGFYCGRVLPVREEQDPKTGSISIHFVTLSERLL